MMKASLFGLLGILACHPVGATGNPDAGKSKTLVCSGCHARDGNSNNPLYPILAGQGQAYLSKQLMDFKRGARKESHMTPIVEGVGAADIPDIAAYFAKQVRKPNAVSDKPSEQGKQLFQSGNDARSISACAGCHSADGKGNAALKFPALAGQHADYVSKTLKDFRSKTRNNDQGALMRNIAADLTDQDIAALAAYIAGLP